MTFRSLLLSTVYRNAGEPGGAPAAKPEDVVAAAAAPAGGDAAGAAEPAAAPSGDGAAAGDAAAGASEPAADAAAAAEGDKPVGGDAAAGGDKDFSSETLLTGEEKKPEDKPAAPDAAPTGEKPAEGDKAAAAAADGGQPGKGDAEGAAKAGDPPPAPKEPPVYSYEFPEGITIDAESLKPVNEAFAKHNIAPDVAKEFMAMHTAALQRFAETTQQASLDDQRRIWAETRGTWRNEIRADEQLGGAGYETNLQRAAQVRDRLVPKDKMADFNRMLLVTGVGDHPEFIRFCVNAHRFVGEPGMPGQQGNPSPNNHKAGGRARLRDTYNTKTA